MNQKLTIISVLSIIFLILATIYVNVSKQRAIDRSKIPEKVEESRGFQRWITNLRNKEFTTNADEFELLEENEIYNTKWMTVYSIDEEGREEEFNTTLKQHHDLKKVIFSPSKRIFIDYRNEKRGDYEPNEVHLYGLKDDKILDARILDCSVRANCYFDRAYFLDNDVFVISEFSRNIKKDEEPFTPCARDETCTYTIKLHIIDLINNKRWVYESNPFDIVLTEIIPEL